MSDERAEKPPGGGRRWLVRLGLVLGVLVVSLGLAELTLRATGFEYHLYPEKLEFGYPDPKVFEDFFQPHEDYLWLSGRSAPKLAAARREKPWLIFSGCSCTEWGEFDVEVAKRVKETPGLAPLTFANLGCSGWSSYQGLQLMKHDIVNIEPKVVTIFYGWNDHWMGFGVDDKTAAKLSHSGVLEQQDLRLVQFVTKALVSRGIDPSKGDGENSRPNRVSLPDFRGNLEEMVELARDHHIVPVLITAPTSHVKGEEPEYLEKRFLKDLSSLVPVHRAYVEVVREVAEEKDVVLCDLAADFDALPREELLTYMKEDGIHFSPEGGVKVGDLLFETLLENDLLQKADGAGR